MANNNLSVLTNLRKQEIEKKKTVVWNDTGLLPLKPKKSGGGRVITTDRLEKIYPHLCQYYELWLGYPEKLLQWYLPSNTRFALFPFQVLTIRASMRYKQHFLVATRGFSKSFSNILIKILQSVLLPGSKHTMVAEHKTQMAKIGREKINELMNLMPGLKQEVNWKKGSQTTMGDDYIRLVFKGKSELDLAGLTNASRGGRRHGLLVDEVKDIPGEELNSIVLPLLNISRRTYSGILLPNEPHQQQIYINPSVFMR